MITELKVVKLFLQDKKPRTIREISFLIKSDYRITHTAVHKLIQKKVIITETIGRSSLCRLSSTYYGLDIYQAETERRKKVLTNGNLKQLYAEIHSKIGTSLFILLLFGSYAKMKQTKFSDIDLIFISNQKDFESIVSDILSLLPLKTHALIFTEEEFIRMKDAKQPNVIQEAIESNIILYGIEAYYKLKNA